MELSLEQIFAGVGVVTATFTPSDQRRMGRDRGAVLHPTAYGTPTWRGTFSLRTFPHAGSELMEARIERLLQTDSTFLICPPSRLSHGTTLTTIAAIGGNDRRLMDVAGTWTAEAGAFVGVVYDGGRRGLHRVFARTGSVLNLTAPLPLSVDVGDPVTFGRPTIRAVLDPSGYDAPTYRAKLAEGIAVSWTQTLDRE